MGFEDAIASEPRASWLFEFVSEGPTSAIDGLLNVESYRPDGRPPEEASIIEKAHSYGAHAVFFEAGRHGRAASPQAFIFLSRDHEKDEAFAEVHKRLWSWGGVPLLYRVSTGQVDLFRCAHEPDFANKGNAPICNPVRTLIIGTKIASDDAWWDATQLRNGTLWDDPKVCKTLLSSNKSAHRKLVEDVRALRNLLESADVLNQSLRRRLLILSLLIAYLEERGVLKINDFTRVLPDAQHFFDVLKTGPALVAILKNLEERFNGQIFSLSEMDRETLLLGEDLDHFARLVEGYQDSTGQLNLWRLYSFRDLPVELISNIYQLFVADAATAVYTPSALVKLVLEETLSWERLDTLVAGNGVILDPACGSGIFLGEAYKRLVLHWRSRNQWQRPEVDTLRKLLLRVHGIDLEQDAIELAAFSLCLALCDALEPEEIRASVKLFPLLDGETLHKSCFFEAKENGLVTVPVAVIVGNPPFTSSLKTEGAKRSYAAYNEDHTQLPDKQLAYLFLQSAMEMVEDDGILALIEPAGLLYNMNTQSFRKAFFNQWQVREVLDFVSVRGIFKKGQADPKVIVIVAEPSETNSKTKTLHAVFRRNGRALAEQKFDIDYYDFHWLEKSETQHNYSWRANLLGGHRVYEFISRIRSYPTLRDYASERNWDFGTGYTSGKQNHSQPAEHLKGQPLLLTNGLGKNGIDHQLIEQVPDAPIERARTAKRFTPPLLLIKMQEELHRCLWTKHSLAYKFRIVGLAAPHSDLERLKAVEEWLESEDSVLQAYTAGMSSSLFTQRATSILSEDIFALPYPTDHSLNLSVNERIVAQDIVDYQRDFIRRGTESALMKKVTSNALSQFDKTLIKQIEKVYSNKPLRALDPQEWPGVICRAYAFGEGRADWSGAEELYGKLDALLQDQSMERLTTTRITRIYDGNFLFLLKPDRHRFWTKSIALRDSDDVLSDLRAQGF